jgi:hypothetical protein
MLTRALRLERRLPRFVPLAISIHVVLAIGFVLGTAYRVLLLPDAIFDTDFMVFRSAWWQILHEPASSLYNAAAQRSAQHALMAGRQFQGGLMAFLNPPHAALAFAGFGWLADHTSLRIAYLVWTLLNVGLLVWFDRAIRGILGAMRGEPRWLFTFAVLAFYPVTYTIAIGQLSLLLAVAACGLLVALESNRALVAAVWLLVLSAKPQLLPPLIVFMAMSGYWRALGWAAVLGVASAAVAALALDPFIWQYYLRNLQTLEQFFGAGTPIHMMNLRGALTSLLGAQATPRAIYIASILAWFMAIAALAVVLRKPAADRSDARGRYALSLATALLFCPHLFPQDTVIWIVALAVFIQSLREGARRGWMLFAGFALCWPVVFALARASQRAWTTWPVSLNPAIVLLVLAFLTIGTAVARPREDRTLTPSEHHQI